MVGCTIQNLYRIYIIDIDISWIQFSKEVNDHAHEFITGSQQGKLVWHGWLDGKTDMAQIMNHTDMDNAEYTNL